MNKTHRRKGHAADLTDKVVSIALAQAKARRTHSERNVALILISLSTGLRAGEIASLTWKMLLEDDGNVGSTLTLPNDVAKWNSGAVLPLAKPLRDALQRLLDWTRETVGVEPNQPVFLSQKGSQGLTRQAIVDLFRKIWADAGSEGSSHSGRRWFITHAARNVSSVGGSLKDVMHLARHKHMSTTQLYVAQNTKAQVELVNVIGKALR